MKVRRLALIVFLAFPAPAAAAPFGELPFQRVQAGVGPAAPELPPGVDDAADTRWVRVEVVQRGSERQRSATIRLRG